MAKPSQISRSRFLAKAGPMMVMLGNVPLGSADHKEFNPNKDDGKASFGFGLNGKANVEIDGVIVPCMVSLNVVVIGSKDAAA